jgi:hypothetical protein
LSFRPRVEQLEDRSVPSTTVSIDNVTVALGVTEAGFTLTRTGDTTPSVQVDFTTVDGTAVTGVNYTATSGSVTFASGQTTALLPIPILAHSPTTDLTFTVDLTGITVLSPTLPAAFATQQTFPAGNRPVSVAVADINGDGKPDIIVASNGFGANSVSVLLNTTAPGATTPSFAPQQTFATGSVPSSVAVVDVNGDGSPDIITANGSANTVSVLLNQNVLSLVGPGTATIEGGEGSPSGSTSPAFVSVALGPPGQVLSVVDSAGVLTQADPTGTHTIGGGIRSQSVAFTPTGHPVLVIAFADGALVQFDATGAHLISPGGVLNANVAFDASGREALVVTYTDGGQVLFDASGAHLLGIADLQSASVAFGPLGETLLLTYADGGLVQFDARGAHLLSASGVRSAAVAFGPSGAKVTVVLFKDGALVQFDASGAHLLGTVM